MARYALANKLEIVEITSTELEPSPLLPIAHYFSAVYTLHRATTERHLVGACADAARRLVQRRNSVNDWSSVYPHVPSMCATTILPIRQ